MLAVIDASRQDTGQTEFARRQPTPDIRAAPGMCVHQINLMPDQNLPDPFCRAPVEIAAAGNGLNVNAGYLRRLTHC